MGKKYFFNPKQKKDAIFIWYYIIWNIFEIIRGTFFVDGYWDMKALVGNGMALLIPIVAYSASNKFVLQSIFSYYLRYALPLFGLVCLLISKNVYGQYLVPISFLMFFFPILNLRWKVIVVFFTLVVMFADLGARSNVIKFAVPICLLAVYYFRKFISVGILEVIRKLLFLLPIVFFALGVTGTFNVFNMDEYIEGDYTQVGKDVYGEQVEDNLKADTRTPLYIEVLETAVKYDTWILGRSPARGNETTLFESLTEVIGKNERYGNEVAILNIFTWTGIVGVFLYMLAFYKASYLALNKSKNIFSKMIGLFISFHWVYSWVEDINYFSLSTFLLWFMIGFSISESFRSMTNRQIRDWVKGIYDKEYKNLYLRNAKENERRRDSYSDTPNLS